MNSMIESSVKKLLTSKVSTFKQIENQKLNLPNLKQCLIYL